MKELGNIEKQEIGRWANNRVENSHPARFDDENGAMLRFRQMKTLQQFASVHASFHNHFNQERHPRQAERSTKPDAQPALAEWRSLVA